MAKTYDLQANRREIFGKKVKQLRKTGVVPANIFGGKQSLAIQVDEKKLEKTLDDAGLTSVVYISVEDAKKKHSVMVSDLMRDPVSGDLLHVDFQEVKLTEKIEANIPVEFVGESAAVKGGGVFVAVLSEIAVRALPTELPEKFEVDISTLENVGDEVRLNAISYDREKVELVTEPDALVALVQEAAKEEVVETPAEEGAEGAEATPSEEATSTPAESTSTENNS